MNRKLIDSLVGLFLLGALFFAILGVVSRPALQNLLGHKVEAVTRMPTAAVKAGDPVLFHSWRVGTVLRVAPHFDRDADWFDVRIAVDEDFARVIPADSTTSLATGAFGDITGAKLVLEPPEHAAGGSLAEWRGPDPPLLAFDQPPDLIGGLQDELLPTVKNILANVERLTAQISDPDGNLMQTLAQVRTTMENVNDPQGNLQGALAEFHELMRSLNAQEGPVQGLLRETEATLANVRALTDELAKSSLQADVATLVKDGSAVMQRLEEVLTTSRATLENVEVATRELPAMLESLRNVLGRLDTASLELPGVAEDVHALLGQVDQTLRQVQQTIANVPIVGAAAVEPPPPEPLVLPASLGAAPASGGVGGAP